MCTQWLLLASLSACICGSAADSADNYTLACFSQEELADIWRITGTPEKRTTTPILVDKSTWLALALATTANVIVLREVLGFQVVVTELSLESEQQSLDRLATKLADVNFGVPTGYGLFQDESYDKFVSREHTVLDFRQSAALSRHGWFVPTYVVTLQPTASVDFWRSLTQAAAIDVLSVNGTLWVDPSYYIEPPDVPVWCEQQRCAELVVATSKWDNNRAIRIVQSLELRVSIVYVGDSLSDIVQARYDAQLPVLIGTVEPSEYTVLEKFTRVLFPGFTHECYEEDGHEGCDYPATPLKKFVRTQFVGFRSLECLAEVDLTEKEVEDLKEQQGEARHPFKDVVTFVSRYQFNTNDMELLLIDLGPEGRLHKNDTAMHEASCRWLKDEENQKRWIEWSVNTPTTQAVPIATAVVWTVDSICLSLAVATLVLQVVLWLYRDIAPLRSMSFANAKFFYQAILLGAHLLYATCYFLSRTQNGSCLVKYPIFGMGFYLMLGVLVLINYRTLRIFKGGDMEKVPSERRTAFVIGLLVLSELLLSLTWYVFDAPKRSLIPIATTSTMLEYRVGCDFEHPLIYFSVYLVPKLALLLFGVVVSWRTAGLSYNFNESGKLALVFSVVTACALAAVVLTQIPGWLPTIHFIASSSLLLFCVVFTIMLFFGSKLLVIVSGRAEKTTNRRGHDPLAGLRHSFLSHRFSDSVENASPSLSQDDFHLQGDRGSVDNADETNEIKQWSPPTLTSAAAVSATATATASSSATAPAAASSSSSSLSPPSSSRATHSPTRRADESASLGLFSSMAAMLGKGDADKDGAAGEREEVSLTPRSRLKRGGGGLSRLRPPLNKQNSSINGGVPSPVVVPDDFAL